MIKIGVLAMGGPQGAIVMARVPEGQAGAEALLVIRKGGKYGILTVFKPSFTVSLNYPL